MSKQFKVVDTRSSEYRHPLDKTTHGLTAGYFRISDEAQLYAIRAFRLKLVSFPGHDRIKLPPDFEDIMRGHHGELPKRVRKKLAALSRRRKQELIYAMVSLAHDGWVRDHPKYFFDEKYADQRFLFLRVELCGLTGFNYFLEMIEGLLERLGLNDYLARCDLEDYYCQRRRKFVQDNGLSDSNLAEYVANCGRDYLALSSEISIALQRDSALAEGIAKQVPSHTALDSAVFL